MSSNNLQEHQSNCLLKVVQCPNSRCTEKVTRQDMGNHMASECSWRIIYCGYCQKLIVFNQQKVCRYHASFEWKGSLLHGLAIFFCPWKILSKLFPWLLINLSVSLYLYWVISLHSKICSSVLKSFFIIFSVRNVRWPKRLKHELKRKRNYQK